MEHNLHKKVYAFGKIVSSFIGRNVYVIDAYIFLTKLNTATYLPFLKDYLLELIKNFFEIFAVECGCNKMGPQLIF